MRYLRKFFEFNSHPTVWEVNWDKYLPKEIIVIKGDTTDLEGYIDEKTREHLLDENGKKISMKYKRGNIMKNPTEQITYDRDFDVEGIPDTLEFDMSFLTESDGNFSLIIEITFGDLVTTGFKITSPNKVFEPFEYTSFHSMMDPSNTVFALNESSLQGLLKFINAVDGFNIKREQLHFLDAKDNYHPHH